MTSDDSDLNIAEKNAVGGGGLVNKDLNGLKPITKQW